MSIVRSGREIDYGWFSVGSKRKENYDDWWRCELRFNAELDELFGVTTTKQVIHPTEELKTGLLGLKDGHYFRKKDGAQLPLQTDVVMITRIKSGKSKVQP